MPDTLPLDVVSGINSNAQFLLNRDTDLRMKNAMSDFQMPMAYKIPEFKDDNYSQSDLLNPSINADILKKGMMSSDADVRQKAFDMYNKQFQGNAIQKGVGNTITIPYDKSLDRYINGKFGYIPEYSPQENEDYNYRLDYMSHNLPSRIVRNIGTGIARFGTSVALKLGQTIGYTAGIIGDGIKHLLTDQSGDAFLTDVADNSMARWFQNLEDDAKNSRALSVFKPAGWDKKGFFSKMANGAFWTDEVADGAAFMGEMVAASYLMGGLGNLVGLGKLGEIPINMASKLGTAGKVLDFATKLTTGAEDIAGIGRWAFNTASEAAFEAADGYQTVTQDLKDQRAQGKNNMSDDDIRKIAGDRAASRFKANMLILSLSNAFENKFIFSPILKRIHGEEAHLNPNSSLIGLGSDAEASMKTWNYATKIGKYLDWKNPASRLRFYGGRGLGATVMEGFWEENAQLAAQRLAANNNLTWGSFWSQLYGQTKSAIQGKDPEAADNIGLGALIGVLGTGAISKVFGGERLMHGERRGIISSTTAAVNQYEKARKEFMSWQDVFKKDDKGNVQVDDKGNPIVDPDKAAAKLDGIYKFNDKLQAVDIIKDPLYRKTVQDSALADYVWAAKAAGIFDRTLSKFDAMKNMKVEDLRSMGFDKSFSSDPIKVKDKMKQLGELYNQATNNNIKLADDSESTLATDYQRKNTLYNYLAAATSAKEVADQFRDRHTAKVAILSAFSPDAFGETSDVQEYNTLTYQQKALDETQKMDSENGNFFTQFYNEQKKAIEDRKAQLMQGLQDAIDQNKIAKSDDDILYNPDRYKGLNDTDKKESLDANNGNLRKTGEHTNVINQSNYVANKISDKVKGMENYSNLVDQIASIQRKDSQADEKKQQEEQGKPNTEKTGGVEDIPFEEVKNEEGKKEEGLPLPVPTQEQGKPEETKPEGPKTEDVTYDESKDNEKEKGTSPLLDQDKLKEWVPDEVDPNKPISYEYPNITSKRDTKDVNDKTEQLVNNHYDMMRAEFIKRIIYLNKEFENNYRLFMVKDSFPEIYQGVKDKYGNDLVKQVDGKWQFTDPNNIGHVIVVENKNGTRPTVKDFFGNKYESVGQHPIIFSMDRGLDNGMWIQEPLYTMRAQILASKDEIASSIDEAKAFYNDEMMSAKKAKEYLDAHPEDKIAIAIAEVTNGIRPTTREWEPVESRISKDFALHIVRDAKADGYPKGTVVARVNKVGFPVSTLKISEYPALMSKIADTLSYIFPTAEEADRIVKDFLEVMVYTNEKRFFTVDTIEGGFKINYKMVPDSAIIPQGMPKGFIRAMGVMANESIGDAHVQVSEKAMKEGYLDFDPKTGKTEFLTKDDYMSFIHPKVVTNLKTILDQNGKLHMGAVNPYFSFVINDERIEGIQFMDKGTPEQNFDLYRARIDALIRQDNVDYDQIKAGLDDDLQKQNITPEQHEQLLNMIKPHIRNIPFEEVVFPEKVEEEKKPEEKPDPLAKYKNKEKEDVAKAMQGPVSTDYIVKVRGNEWIWNPDNNKIYMRGTQDELGFGSSTFGQVLSELAKVYPFSSTETGDRGFAKVEVTDVDGNKYTVYAGTTQVGNPEYVINSRGIGEMGQGEKTAADMLKDKLDKENRDKLEEFQKRYCK